MGVIANSPTREGPGTRFSTDQWSRNSKNCGTTAGHERNKRFGTVPPLFTALSRPRGMVDSMSPCRSCGVEIPTASTECPACGYDSASHNRRRLYLGALGTGLTLTVVLAPIGIPILLAAARQREFAERGVTQQEQKSLWSHVQAVLRHHISLEPLIEPNHEFTRGGSDDGVDSGRPPSL